MIGRSILRIMGWSFEGGFPDTGKMVLIVAPHTSNWDFFIGIAVCFAIGFRGSWLGKHTIFRAPFRSYMRWLGGIPVDRSKSTGVVDQVVELFNSSDHLILGMSPEGTRSKVTRWKTGFYHIANGAGVPILPVYFDYGRKVVGLTDPFYTTGDVDRDIAVLKEIYKGVQAKNPEKY